MKGFHMKSPLLFGDTIVPKRRGNDKLREAPWRALLFSKQSQEAMHDECINLAELSVPENLWECSHNTKPMLLP